MTTQSENLNELAVALAKAQGEITPAEKDGLNPHFKSKYATLDSVWAACRQPLSKNGLSILQTISIDGENMLLTTTLLHSSGQWVKSIIPIASGKMSPQVIGSALSYFKRYSLASMVGVVAGDDDDGESAQKARNVPVVEQKFITPQQASEIRSILDEAILPFEPAYTETFLKVYKSASIEKMPSEAYSRALIYLKKKADSLKDEDINF